MRLVAAIGAAIAIGAAAAPAAAAAAQPDQQPWQAAEQLTSSLFSAESELLLDPDAKPSETIALAAGRGKVLAALRRASYLIVLRAVRRGDVATARRWLLVRDFRAATRFTRPGVDATETLDALAASKATPAQAATEVKKDLLDAYQGQLAANLHEALEADRRGFAARRAETAEIAAGYWLIIRPEYIAQRDAATARSLDRAFRRLASGAPGGGPGFRSAAARIEVGLDGFTAAAFTAEEQARRASQLLRFVDLIPVEYDHGTDDGHVTRAFELQEALAFLDGGDAAFADLKGTLEQRDAAGVAEIDAGLTTMRGLVSRASEGGEVAPQEEIDAASDRSHDALERILPDEWKQSGDDADFDLIQISLDQMEAAIGAGEYDQAEQARLAAYSFLEFGPELKLKAFNVQLATEIEGLFWYGAGGQQGLAQLVADHAGADQLRDTRVPLDEKLAEARGTLGEDASATTAIINSALIVFREGLEAVLILAAITASLVGARRRLRRPVLRGALLALPASLALFALALTVIDSLSRYGERLEAVVGLVAIGVLLVTLNWFFHRVYWTEWISSHRRRGVRLAGAAAGGAAGATIAGLYLLGFTSVFREGFETVLFLQAVQLSSGTGIVLAGMALGLTATAAVGAVTFALERRLPYKRMLAVTGLLIALVLVVMVGTTVRVMQGVGWLPITPLDFQLPLWTGTWLGVFPTVETLAAQVAALGFVIGSYFLAEWVRKRNVRRAISERVGTVKPTVLPPNSNGAAVRRSPRARSGSSSEA